VPAPARPWSRRSPTSAPELADLRGVKETPPPKSDEIFLVLTTSGEGGDVRLGLLDLGRIGSSYSIWRRPEKGRELLLAVARRRGRALLLAVLCLPASQRRGRRGGGGEAASPPPPLLCVPLLLRLPAPSRPLHPTARAPLPSPDALRAAQSSQPSLSSLLSHSRLKCI
jgi:hypothetical protein